MTSREQERLILENAQIKRENDGFRYNIRVVSRRLKEIDAALQALAHGGPLSLDADIRQLAPAGREAAIRDARVIEGDRET